MKTRNKHIILAIVNLVILVCLSRPSFSVSYGVGGLRKEGGTFKQWTGTDLYIVDVGLIWDLPDTNPSDEIDYYEHTMSDADYCDNASHKAGGEKFDHWHVESGVGFPTTGIPGSVALITSEECNEYYNARFLYDGLKDGNNMSVDGVNTVPGLDDGQDANSSDNSPNLTYNCHGYAFDKDGKSQYKLLINDANGAGVILNPDNGVYEEVEFGTECVDNDIMSMPTHTNFIQDAKNNGCCNILQLKFKFRCSGIYTYDYNEPGRDGDQLWDGKTPKYYQ